MNSIFKKPLLRKAQLNAEVFLITQKYEKRGTYAFS